MPMLLYGNGMISGITSVSTPSSITMSGNTSFINGLSVTGNITNISPTSLGVYIGRDPDTPNNAGIDIACSSTGYGWLDFTGSTGADAKGRVGYSLSNDKMNLVTNGASRVDIDSSGRVTKPYQPAFIAGSPAPTATYTPGQKVVYNNSIHNIGSVYNTSSSRFTAPVTGFHLIKAQLWTYGSGSYVGAAEFYVNGSRRYGSFGNEAQSIGWFAYAMIEMFYLNANDYVEVYCRSGTVYTDSNYSVFSGYLLG